MTPRRRNAFCIHPGVLVSSYWSKSGDCIAYGVYGRSCSTYLQLMIFFTQSSVFNIRCFAKHADPNLHVALYLQCPGGNPVKYSNSTSFEHSTSFFDNFKIFERFRMLTSSNCSNDTSWTPSECSLRLWRDLGDTPSEPGRLLHDIGDSSSELGRLLSDVGVLSSELR